MVKKHTPFKFRAYFIQKLAWYCIGCTLASIGVKCFLVPNHLIDSGVVGLAMLLAHLVGEKYLPIFLIICNIPFVILAYKQIGKHFVIQMVATLFIFAIALTAASVLPAMLNKPPFEFYGSDLEVMVIGGFIIGCGIGLIIKNGGSTDGTEILGIIISRKKGFTVGQVVLFVNFFVFALSGLVYKNIHSAFLSLMTFAIATKVMDVVINGFEDTKSVMIISSKTKMISLLLIEKMKLGVTIMYGRGGYSGEDKEILYVVIERLRLSEMKAMVQKEDPQAFMAIESLHEVVNGQRSEGTVQKTIH